MKNYIRIVFLILGVALTICMPNPAQAQNTSEALEGRVLEVIETSEQIREDGSTQPYQKLLIEIYTPGQAGTTVEVEQGTLPFAHTETYEVGDRVVLQKTQLPDNAINYIIIDHVRRSTLWWLFILFVGLVTAIGRKGGLAALIGMALSFGVIFWYVLPQILEGTSPVVVALIGALIIVPTTFYLSHGFNRKTHIAIVGTLITLSLTGMLASSVISSAHLTGYASEEAGMLEAQRMGEINMQGLLLAGIIIGVLGILDDITVSQASIVQQLKKANRSFNYFELFNRAMTVGRDHIASLVNTLVLVYAGASLPLMLLFINNPRPFTEVINYEFVSDEVIRMLVGSIGLVLAVPITTALASFIFSQPPHTTSQDTRGKKKR